MFGTLPMGDDKIVTMPRSPQTYGRSKGCEPDEMSRMIGFREIVVDNSVDSCVVGVTVSL